MDHLVHAGEVTVTAHLRTVKRLKTYSNIQHQKASPITIAWILPATKSLDFSRESEEPLSQIIEDPSIEAVSKFAQLYSVDYKFLTVHTGVTRSSLNP